MQSRRQKEQAMVVAALAEEALAAEGLAARQGEAVASLEGPACPQGCAAKILDEFH